jgi:hypothetical protein
MTILVRESVPILSIDVCIEFNAKKIEEEIFYLIQISTNHHLMFGMYLMMLIENEYVNIAYYLTEEVMIMFY